VVGYLVEQHVRHQLGVQGFAVGSGLVLPLLRLLLLPSVVLPSLVSEQSGLVLVDLLRDVVRQIGQVSNMGEVLP